MYSLEIADGVVAARTLYGAEDFCTVMQKNPTISEKNYNVMC